VSDQWVRLVQFPDAILAGSSVTPPRSRAGVRPRRLGLERGALGPGVASSTKKPGDVRSPPFLGQGAGRHIRRGPPPCTDKCITSSHCHTQQHLNKHTKALLRRASSCQDLCIRGTKISFIFVECHYEPVPKMQPCQHTNRCVRPTSAGGCRSGWAGTTTRRCRRRCCRCGNQWQRATLPHCSRHADPREPPAAAAAAQQRPPLR
jgi:hypothetical protein